MKTWLSSIVLGLTITTAFAQPIPLIDTHVHFQAGAGRDFKASLQVVLATMDRLGIERVILMPPPLTHLGRPLFYDAEGLLFAQTVAPGRVAVIGGSSLNVMIHTTPPESVTDEIRQTFRRRAEAILAQGAVGFGEIAIHHVSVPAMGPQHPYENVPTTHPLLLLLIDIAAENDVPIDLHFDLVTEDMGLPHTLRANALNPEVLKANAAAFSFLLSHNSKARIVWSHVGFEPLLTRQPKQVRNYLRDFPNLSMSFRLTNATSNPASALWPDGRVKAEWIDLVSEFPDRFMLGSDAFYDRSGIARGSSERALGNLRALVEALPQKAGVAVARENAIRIYKLSAAPTPQ